MCNTETMHKLDQACERIFHTFQQEKERRRKELRRRRKQLQISSSHLHSGDAGLKRHRYELQNERGKPKRVPELPSLEDRYVQELMSSINGITMECGASWMSLEPTRGRFVNLDKALVHLNYAIGHYKQVHTIIESMEPSKIPLSLEGELEILWENAAYKLEQARNPYLNMNSVNMYRIRRRYQCPTLKRSGLKKYRISEAARRHLDRQFRVNPKPLRADKQELAAITGMKVETVSNWFKNKRQRQKKMKQEEPCWPEQLVEPDPAVAIEPKTDYSALIGQEARRAATPQPVVEHHLAQTGAYQSPQEILYSPAMYHHYHYQQQQQQQQQLPYLQDIPPVGLNYAPPPSLPPSSFSSGQYSAADEDQYFPVTMGPNESELLYAEFAYDGVIIS